MKDNEVWTAEKVIEVQKLITLLSVDSLERMIVSEGDEVGELSNLIPDNSPGPQEIVERQDTINVLNEYVNKLKPRECMVIKMRYGLLDGKFKTLEEIGQYFGVSRERIRQVEERGLKRLKHMLTANGKYRNINDF